MMAGVYHPPRIQTEVEAGIMSPMVMWDKKET
jgi:hypothetical protein